MKKYTHIVNGKIKKINKPHPLENTYDKSIFIKRLVNNLGHSTELLKCDLKNLCYIINSNFESYVYVEHMDGGGIDVRKKISIPSINPYARNYSIQSQMFSIVDGDLPILIINEYVPLVMDKNNNISLADTSVYTIIEPEDFYKSKSVQARCGNASSRWVSIEDLYQCYKSNVIMMNHADNVHVVPSSKIFTFLNRLLKGEKTERVEFHNPKQPRYTKKIQYHPKNNNDILDEEVLNEEAAQTEFRNALIKRSKGRCEFCGCTYPLDSMIASHTYPRELIRNDACLDFKQKYNMIADPNNGFLLCRNCDGLYDNYYLTFDKYWRLFCDAINFINMDEVEQWCMVRVYVDLIGQVILKEHLMTEEAWKYMQMRNRLVVEKMKNSLTSVNTKGFVLTW